MPLPLQVSAPLHISPSEHDAPEARLPLCPQVALVLPTESKLAVQISDPLHRLPSSGQEVPGWALCCDIPFALQESAVHAFESSRTVDNVP